MTTASTWLMSEAKAIGRGDFSRDIEDVPFGYVDGTQERDVSQMLDALVLAETPFINRVGWGSDSGGTSIEWMSEDLGPGMVRNIAAIESVQTSFVCNSVNGMIASDSIAQIKQGSILYHYASETAAHIFNVVTSTAYGAGGVSVFTSNVSGTQVSIVANETFYVLGAVANEGSMPNEPTPRRRALTSNYFGILREDVQITGSMKNTDMYVISREDKHQMLMRLKEIQRNRERIALYGIRVARSSVIASMPDGAFGFLNAQSGTHINTSTYVLTDTAVNNMVSFLWENGGKNLSFYAHIDQIGKFTDWDKSRIRMSVNDRKGGGWITKYLTKSGIEIDLVPMGNVPTNLGFMIDDSKVKLRAKKGRKLVIEKLGKMGDFDDWQMISEFSVEMKGHNLKQHGLFAALT